MAAITKDQVAVTIRQIEMNDPTMDRADFVERVIVKLYNAIDELQTQVVALGGTIAQPNIDILP